MSNQENTSNIKKNELSEFTQLAKKLFSVPKSEIQEKENPESSNSNPTKP